MVNHHQEQVQVQGEVPEERSEETDLGDENVLLLGGTGSVWVFAHLLIF